MSQHIVFHRPEPHNAPSTRVIAHCHIKQTSVNPKELDPFDQEFNKAKLDTKVKKIRDRYRFVVKKPKGQPHPEAPLSAKT